MVEKKKPELDLTGVDSNAFVLLAKARRVAKDNGMDWAKIQTEATAKDYDGLIQTLNKYFDVTLYESRR
jgi:hypothetical protein